MEFLGDSLSDKKNIEFLSAPSPDALRDQLRQIKLPYKLVTIYAQGGAHIAWIVPTLPVQKVQKKTKSKEI